jgi:diacylglycerol kinase family enzyme
MTRSTSTHRVSISQQALAVIALIAAAVLVVVVLVFLLRNGAYIVLGVAGLIVASGSGWWMITERSVRRAMGIAGVVLGVGALAVALVGSAVGTEQRILRVALVGALLTVMIVAARGALGGDAHEVDRQRSHRASPPGHPVLICNPWSGGGKVKRFGLIELATDLGIETLVLDRGLDLEQLARGAIAQGADCLGMAGGDGSQALVASIAIEHDVPFVCVSAGTRNHFALDLGIDRKDPRHSVYAFRDAFERRVDYATVNGRLFVNNVSLGVYATIVQQESYRDTKVETSKTLLPELLGKTEHPFDLQFVTPDGTEVNGSFLIMVSNNPYVLGATFDVSQRRRLDSGELGIFAVNAATGREAAQVMTFALLGRSGKSGHAYEFTSGTFEVRSRSGKAFAGIDGEALELETPLEFRIHPKGLRMLVTEDNLATAQWRQARNVNIHDLLSIARGRESEMRVEPQRGGRRK